MTQGPNLRETAMSFAATAVSRSARKEFFIGLIGLLCLGALAGLFWVLALSKDDPSTTMLVIAGVASVPALLMGWYVVSRLQRWSDPTRSSFYALLAEPSQIKQVRDQHITYRASGARLGSEYIINVSGSGKDGYCRLNADSFAAIKGYLVAHCPAEAFQLPADTAEPASDAAA